MNRDTLIAQVKDEYARIASTESLQQTEQYTTEISPEAYYEKLLGQTIDAISNGTFDRFGSGEEIVNAVANDKNLLSG